MAWSWYISSEQKAAAEKIQLTDREAIVLVNMEYIGDEGTTVWEYCGGFDLSDSAQFEAYTSLGRFGFIVAKTPREVRSASTVDVISPAGKAKIDKIRAYHYKCCEYTIHLPCVCMERTYCPNPDHHGGCHGTHD